MVRVHSLRSQSTGFATMEDNDAKLIPAGNLLKEVEINGLVNVNKDQLHDDIFDGVELVEAEVTLEQSVTENGVLAHSMDAVDSLVIRNGSDDVTDSAPVASLISKFDTSSRYDMKHKERGCFLIFSMEMFEPSLGLDNRTGTRKDAFNMLHTAKHMGFEYIQTFHNPTKNDVLDWMRGISKASHHGYDCFGCAILTHGDVDDTLYARDDTFKLSEITNMYTAENCPSLAGKPKLFFIQACRGERKDTGSSITLQHLSYPGRVERPPSSKRPNHADFLIAFSTVPGFMSWRNTLNGSWFVQALHHCFSEYVKSMELMQIMTKVNSMVAFFESHSGKENSGYKQIPAVTSQLTAEVYFWNWTLDDETSCPVCKTQLQPSPLSSSKDIPSTSQSSNAISEAGEAPGDKLKIRKSKSLRKWIRQSFRKKNSA